jgi:2-polyprenyl-3-methyl-5-hydroxy-6-metoxy-1,4-benzoquinol methylase
VTAFDVIEHCPNPQGLMRTMNRLIKRGGIVMLSTHDIGNILARWYGTRWRYIAPIGHLTYFTRTTLAKMMTRCGFQVLRSGGSHTIDDRALAQARNYLTQSARLLLLRALILWFYKPLSVHMPSLTKWEFRTRNGIVNHEKLLLRAGTQVIMNDDMVLIARKM